MCLLFILLIFNFCQYRALNIELSYLPNIEANVEQLEHSFDGRRYSNNNATQLEYSFQKVNHTGFFN
jgi:hypothetical protein